MSEIVTSYFGQAKNLRKEGYRIISISRYNPQFCKVDTTLIQLAPTAAMLKMSWSQYDILYQEILKKVDLRIVKNVLSQYNKSALCCYEKDVNDCHRREAGIFLSQKLGIEIREFVPINQPKPKKEKIQKPDAQLVIFTVNNDQRK